MKTEKPESINEYLMPFPEEVQVALENLRAIIHDFVPDLQESISYMVPVFKYKGHSLVGFAAFKKHCSFFVMSSPEIMQSFESELKGIKYTGATIHFQPQKPLPTALIHKILTLRMAENDARFTGKKK